ncbi:MAG: hypothetical protein EXR98_22315 [Gemmataceae bacterium]|nr:hypothetical protein [Gemmataceae bacterium]
MIRWMMVPFTFVLCLFLVAEGTSQDKKKKATTITGALTAVEAAKDSKDTGTITVKTPEKKKKDVVIAEAKEHKIEVTKDTKIEKAGEKKKDPPVAATFADLQKELNVAVSHIDGKAERILILPKKK